MKYFDVCLSFKFKDSFETAKLIKNQMEAEGITCYFDYDDQTEIIQNGIEVATEMVYGSCSRFKVVLLSDNYFLENSYPYKEWNAINNSLKKVNNSKDYFLVCSKKNSTFLTNSNFNFFYYSDVNKLALQLVDYIKNYYISNRYSQFNLNHIVLENEIQSISDSIFNENKSFVLKAPSGVGKTEFVKSIVRFHTYKNDENTPIIYYNFSADSLEQEMAIKTILNCSIAKKTKEEDLPANLVFEDTLSNFAKENTKFSNIVTDLQVDEIDKNYFAEALFNYFKWLIARNNKLIIIFDNFQHCSESRNELLIEKLTLLSNVQFIFIVTSNELLCSYNSIIEKINDKKIEINMPIIQEQDILQIILSKICNIDYKDMKQIADFSKIKKYYNLKIIDILCCFYKHYGKKSLQLRASDALKLLPKKQQDFLRLVYISGGKINSVVVETIFKYGYADITILENLHCIEIQNNKISFAHDTISIFTKEISQNLTKFCKDSQAKIVAYLTDSNNNLENIKLELMETYDNILTVYNGTWFNALGIFAEYIKLLSIKQAYHTIVEIKESFENSIFDPFEFLNQETVGYLLEAYIKTAKIKKGLEIVASLHTKNKNIIRLESKLMIQDYRYDYAIKRLDYELKEQFDPELAMMLCNALAHKRYESRILKIKNQFEYFNKDNVYYNIVLRNTGHLFEIDTAIANITDAMRYFSNKKFEYATCCNNLGLQYVRKYLKVLDEKILSNAEANFQLAIKTFNALNENEVYQATFNLCLVEACRSNYKSAIAYVEQALSFVSSDLHFDIYKFEVTKVCLELLNGTISINNCIDFLKFKKKNLIEDFKNHDIDFWLPYQINYNLEVLSNIKNGINTMINPRDFSKKYFKNEDGENYNYDDNYGAYYPCEINKIKVKLLFATSPHWRY